jgi:hypothetical protein
VNSMTNASQFYDAVPAPGGVRLVPRKGSAMEKAMRRMYPGVKFYDAPIQLQSLPGTAQNNLRLPRYKTPAKPPETADRRYRARDNGDPVPLDPDLLELARRAGSQAIVEEIYKEQQKRDARREMNGGNGDCAGPRYRGRDQGPSPTRAVQAVTRDVNRLSEVGEEVDRDEQLPDDYEGPDFEQDQEHEEPDGDETVQVIGTLEPPPDGYTYNAYKEDDGSVTVVLEPDTGDAPNTNDRMYRHRISDGVDPVLRRMNKINRVHHVRDADTVSNTLLRHRPGPGCRLALQEDGNGFWSVLLISPAPGDDMTHEQSGAEDLDESDPGDDGDWLPQPEAHDPIQRQQPTPTFRDHRIPEAVTIRQMNANAKAFWQRR